MSDVISKAEIEEHNRKNVKAHIAVGVLIFLLWVLLGLLGINVETGTLLKHDSPLYQSMKVGSTPLDRLLTTFLIMALLQCLVVISWDFKRWRELLDGEINHISYLCLDSTNVFAYIKSVREQIPERKLYTVDLDNCNRIAALEQAERSVAMSNEPNVQPMILDIPSRKAG